MNDLLWLMRLFSIRLRMIGAIGVVFGLLLLLGGVGWWGMQSLLAIKADALQLAQQAAVADPAARATLAALAERSQALDRWAWWLLLLGLPLMLLLVASTTLLNMLSICRPLEQAQGLAVAIARGDLGTQPDLSGRDEISDLMRDLADMQASLARTVGEVRQAAESIRLASGEIASGNQDLSNRTELAAGNLQQTAGRMDQITAAVQQSSAAARSCLLYTSPSPRDS